MNNSNYSNIKVLHYLVSLLTRVTWLY